MNGLKRNTAKLFSDHGKLFILALDHAQGGLTPGLENPRKILGEFADSKIDGFILNVGFADEMAKETLLNKKLILRSSFGGSYVSSEFTNVHTNHVSPEMALAYGADAVLMMFVMGGADYRSIQDAAKAIDAYHKLGIPVIAEILCDDFDKTTTFDIQANGARVAAELGADVVKAFYTEKFDQVIANCPAPVILAGGPKGVGIMEVAQAALKDGVKGFAFGRNIFQAEDKRKVTEDIYNLFLR